MNNKNHNTPHIASISVAIQIDTCNIAIPTKNKIEHWLAKAYDLLADTVDRSKQYLVIRIIDETQSAALNKKYRHQSGPTNVLSFPDTNIPGFPSDSFGDMAICAPLVIAEAQQQNKSIEAHWAHLIIHGFLHLNGYDHIKPQDAEKMETLEIAILASLGIPNPYAE